MSLSSTFCWFTLDKLPPTEITTSDCEQALFYPLLTWLRKILSEIIAAVQQRRLPQRKELFRGICYVHMLTINSYVTAENVCALLR